MADCSRNWVTFHMQTLIVLDTSFPVKRISFAPAVIVASKSCVGGPRFSTSPAPRRTMHRASDSIRSISPVPFFPKTFFDERDIENIVAQVTKMKRHGASRSTSLKVAAVLQQFTHGVHSPVVQSRRERAKAKCDSSGN